MLSELSRVVDDRFAIRFCRQDLAGDDPVVIGRDLENIAVDASPKAKGVGQRS